MTFLQVADGLIIVLKLQVTLAQEEVGFDRLAVQLQCTLTICQSLVMLLQLHMAQSPVGVVHCHRWITVLGDRLYQTKYICTVALWYCGLGFTRVLHLQAQENPSLPFFYNR